MTDITTGSIYSAPTQEEISREQLHLDYYGITANNLTDFHPIVGDGPITRQPILDPLTAALAEDGWEYAGAGHFSAVFVKGRLALKLGFKGNDTGAMYAAWCRSNQDLPGVPAIYAISKFSGCYVVLTRRYREGDLDPEVDDELDALMEVINCGRSPVYGFDTIKTAQAIREFFEGVASFDLHSKNVMLDDNDDIVITDPISYGPCSGTWTGSYYPTTGTGATYVG